MMVANDLSDPNIGMESDENAVTIFSRNGESERNFARFQENCRARTRENNLRKREKSFDKKNSEDE
jgi:phosphopantothenoylcysteine synthetase/decarboxylase